MLQDSSLEYENTWKFLERRIDDASGVHEVMMQTDEVLKNLQNAASSGFITVICYFFLNLT
jgi:ubiquinone biosynthesis protein COQ9